MHGAARYTASSNDLARALSFAGQYREAFEVADRNVQLVSEMGRADTNGYLAIVSTACSALRNGGQPRRAVAYLDSHLAKVGHSHDYGDMPVGVRGCWALSHLQMTGSETAEAALLAAVERAEQGGVSTQASPMRAWTVNAALARGELPVAEARWAPLAAAEEHRLAANEKGSDVVRLMIVHARLEVARGKPGEALEILERAAGLITARRQPTNPDARELETVRGEALMAARRYAEAARHAQIAIGLGQNSAIDPGSSAWIGEALLLRARAEAAEGNTNAAATAQQALPELESTLDPAHPLIAEARRLASGPP
jgi:tetratricopeptide (TPR) repeat protein